MYQCVLFDLDGTLVNTYLGIYNSYKYAFEKMKLPFPRATFVGEAIGAPLLSVFRDRVPLSEEQAVKAVDYYREYYARKGKLEAEVYPGMKETLKKIKGKGLSIGVATLKRENFAKDMLTELGISRYFDVIYGIDDRDQLTKAELLKKCMNYLNVKEQETVLVGDSSYDFEGANEVGIDFIAVTYGFGYSNENRPEVKKTNHVADSAQDILSFL